MSENAAPVFGGPGSATIYSDFGGDGENVSMGRSAIQSDGKLVVAGTSDGDFALIRYKTDGSVDATFGNNGQAILNVVDGSITNVSVAVRASDGKIYVAGNYSGSEILVARFNANGTLDKSYGGGDGVATTNFGAACTAADIFIDAFGRALVVGSVADGGSAAMAVARFDFNGASDKTFSLDGSDLQTFGASISAGKAVLASGTRIYVVGNAGADAGSMDFAIACYGMTDGKLDTKFAGDGLLTTDFSGSDCARAVALQTDGKIVVAGATGGGDIAVARYTAGGDLDRNFSADGKVTIDLAQQASALTVVLQGTKILVGGNSGALGGSGKYELVRLNADGTVDTTFGGGDGKITIDLPTPASGANALCELSVQGSKILITENINNGLGDIALIRLNASDGSLDTTFVPPKGALDGAPGYTEDGVAVVLDASVGVFDADLSAAGSYNGASIMLVRHGGANANDVFSGSGKLSIADGGNVALNGLVIGTALNHGGTLVITFNGNATQAAVNQTLSAIAYRNASHIPEVSVQIDWAFNDGNNGAQGTGGAKTVSGSTKVKITAVNDPHGGSVNIDGTVKQGLMLTVNTSMLTDADGLGELHYQWKADGVAIAGATDSTYTLKQAEVGKAVTVEVSYVDGGGTLEKIASGATAAVENVNDVPTGEIAIVGALVSGSWLNADLAALADADGMDLARSAGGISYQWYANGTSIDGANGSSYLLTASEIGKQITLTVIYTDDGGATETVVSAATKGVLDHDTLPVGGVLLHGAFASGQTLTASNTISDANGITSGAISYQWYADGYAIAGATGANFALTNAQIGHTIKAKAFYTDDYGSQEVVWSDESKPIGKSLIGKAGNDQLMGTILGDYLYGLAGNDVLNGGLGDDTLEGGLGNDTYMVDSANDEVIEAENAGIDTVKSAVTYTLADNVENLTLIGTDNVDATGNALDNIIIGNAGENKLNGGAGNDWLDGLGGMDRYYGSAGNDTYVLDLSGELFTTFASDDDGIDTLLITYKNTSATEVQTITLSNTLSGIENVTITGTGLFDINGNDSGNVLIGNASANKITGGSGNDTLNGGAGADTLIGGEGNDIYVIDNAGDLITETGTGSNDVVNSTLTVDLNLSKFDGIEHVTLLGTGKISATGDENKNTLDGSQNAAANTLSGGLSDDTYIVGKGDKVIESADQGADTVQTALTYMLGANLENLTLTGVANVNGTGNELANVLIGNSGNNVLDGKGGADTMLGGTGNDTYYVDSLSDVVCETTTLGGAVDAGGKDTVISSASWALGAFVENLTLTGTNGIGGTGNELDNTIVGNAGNNIIDGGTGDDTLYGLAGNDTLYGGDGDALIGGMGNDVYYLDGDSSVIEASGEGLRDTVILEGEHPGLTRFTLGDNVEVLVHNGTDSFTATGNAGNNILATDDGDDGDCLYGLAGQDILMGGSGDNFFDGGSGVDIVLLDGTSDDYEITSINDDGETIYDSTDLGGEVNTLKNVEIIMFTGGGYEVLAPSSVATKGNDAIYGTAGDNADILDGLAGNDWIAGLGGDDSLSGGLGNDIIYGNSGNDTINGGAGNDILYGGSSSDIDDCMESDGDDDILNGGAGADTMFGGVGNDTYIVDAGDVVIENADEGSDTIMASISYTLGENFENLTLLGTGKINGAGNALDNVLTGNAAANALSGGAGDDSINGGLGNDILTGGSGLDTFMFNTVLKSNVDRIEDFIQGEDKIALAHEVFTQLVGGLSVDALYAGAVAHDADDRILYDYHAGTNSCDLYYDADGTGKTAAIKFATLIGVSAPTAADFVVL